MEKTMRNTESSELYRKIDELGLSAGGHAKAIGALEAADRFTNTIYWVFENIGKLAVWLTPNPKLKHQ